MFVDGSYGKFATNLDFGIF